jgi:EAL and modified HD-GYP domain-containing signal transduction protein
MDTFVARQPILDRHLKTFGYELLFRGGVDNLFPDIDGDTASSAVLSNSFLGIGIERLTGGKKAFINFTRDLLLKQVPCLFSPKILFSELLETLEPDEDLLKAVTQMSRKGCHFALDDFIFHEKFEPLMRFAAIIKIDIRQTSMEEAGQLMDRLGGRPIKFLAEKVETRQEYDEALERGFSYFQGYFFSKPEIISQRSIAPTKLRLLQIIGELNREDADVGRLEELVKTDVSLSYRLLQYLNSAFYHLPNKINSIRGAIVFLGLNEVRKLVTLLATAKLADSKPHELIRTSVLRAKLCELAGQSADYQGDPSELFLLGLFSLMDAILDTDMSQIIDQLPISEVLKRALIEREGELVTYLDLVSCFEKGMWDSCPNLSNSQSAAKLTIDGYAEAVAWADALLG